MNENLCGNENIGVNDGIGGNENLGVNEHLRGNEAANVNAYVRGNERKRVNDNSCGNEPVSVNDNRCGNESARVNDNPRGNESPCVNERIPMILLLGLLFLLVLMYGICLKQVFPIFREIWDETELMNKQACAHTLLNSTGLYDPVEEARIRRDWRWHCTKMQCRNVLRMAGMTLTLPFVFVCICAQVIFQQLFRSK